MTLFTLGGMVLVIDRANVDASGTNQMLGLLAVMVATAAWCVDNTLPRAVADRDPGQVVMLKGALGALGALATTLMAVVFGEAVSALLPTLALLVVGATGDGLSLRFDSLAQRAFGAARTGSVFAFALFVRALFTFTPGERSGNAWIPAGAVLMAQGIVLYLAESHGREHGHDEMENGHAYGHGDGHHTHSHDLLPVGQHSHLHRHEPTRHLHSHVPGEHHAHRHRCEFCSRRSYTTDARKR